jgi:hypothetical protein
LKSFWASPTPGCRSDIFFSLFPHDSWTVHFIAHYGKWAEEFESMILALQKEGDL